MGDAWRSVSSGLGSDDDEIEFELLLEDEDAVYGAGPASSGSAGSAYRVVSGRETLRGGSALSEEFGSARREPRYVRAIAVLAAIAWLVVTMWPASGVGRHRTAPHPFRVRLAGIEMVFPGLGLGANVRLAVGNDAAGSVAVADAYVSARGAFTGELEVARLGALAMEPPKAVGGRSVARVPMQLPFDCSLARAAVVDPTIHLTVAETAPGDQRGEVSFPFTDGQWKMYVAANAAYCRFISGGGIAVTLSYVSRSADPVSRSFDLTLDVANDGLQPWGVLDFSQPVGGLSVGTAPDLPVTIDAHADELITTHWHVDTCVPAVPLWGGAEVDAGLTYEDGLDHLVVPVPISSGLVNAQIAAACRV